MSIRKKNRINCNKEVYNCVAVEILTLIRWGKGIGKGKEKTYVN